MEVNIYYQGYSKKTEINMIRDQKWSIILKIPWVACYNPEINQKIREVKITKYLEKCEKQQGLNVIRQKCGQTLELGLGQR